MDALYCWEIIYQWSWFKNWRQIYASGQKWKRGTRSTLPSETNTRQSRETTIFVTLDVRQWGTVISKRWETTWSEPYDRSSLVAEESFQATVQEGHPAEAQRSPWRETEPRSLWFTELSTDKYTHLRKLLEARVRTTPKVESGRGTSPQSSHMASNSFCSHRADWKISEFTWHWAVSEYFCCTSEAELS